MSPADSSFDDFVVRQGSCVVELLKPSDTGKVVSGMNGAIEHFGLLVDDLEAMVADLRRGGMAFEGHIASVQGLPGRFRIIFLEGPSGGSIELCQIGE